MAFIVPYGEIFDDTLKLWEKYSKEYREIVPEYQRLLEEKRKKNILPLNPIKRTAIGDFPNITLLRISDEEEAIEYMLNVREEYLRDVRRKILSYIGSKLRADLIAKIGDYRYQIRRHDTPKTALAMSAEACGNGRHTNPQIVLAGTKLNEGI